MLDTGGKREQGEERRKQLEKTRRGKDMSHIGMQDVW